MESVEDTNYQRRIAVALEQIVVELQRKRKRRERLSEVEKPRGNEVKPSRQLAIFEQSNTDLILHDVVPLEDSAPPKKELVKIPEDVRNMMPPTPAPPSEPEKPNEEQMVISYPNRTADPLPCPYCHEIIAAGQRHAHPPMGM